MPDWFWLILAAIGVDFLLILFASYLPVGEPKTRGRVREILAIFRTHGISPMLAEEKSSSVFSFYTEWQCHYALKEDCSLCDFDGLSFFIKMKRLQVDWENLEADVKDSGWRLKTIYKNESKRTQPLHLFACSEKCLHVVFLYWRKEGFWWHSSVALDDVPSNYPKRCIPERAFLRVDSKKSKIDGYRVLVPLNRETFSRDLINSEFKRCNYKRATEFYRRFPTLYSQEDLLFRHRSWKVLARAKVVLDNMGVVFWLSSGTFLGYYRQCEIFPYAVDVDIGIWINDYDGDLIDNFERAGFKLKHVFGEVSDSYELSFLYNGIKLDIFFFYEGDTVMWNGGTQAKSGRKFMYIFPKFNLCWTIFLDLFVRIPCPEEPYIEANYGKNWMVPTRSWDWKSSPPNVVDNGTWPYDRWDEVIQVFPD